MEEQEPQQQEEKSKSWFIEIKDEFIKYVKEGTLNYVFGAIFILIVALLTGKLQELYRSILAPVAEVTNCPMGKLDEITGEIHLKGEIKRGGIIKLSVHNKINNSLEIKDNEIIESDGTFKFHFCTAVTDYIEFKVRVRGKEIPRKYNIDEIPKIVSLN